MRNSKLIKSSDLLAEVIHMDYELLTIIKRFGIKLGISDHSIQRICEIYGLNLDFFLEIVNTYYSNDYFSLKNPHSISIVQIVNYLKSSHNYYNNEKILAIESQIQNLEWASADHERNYSILIKFFNEYKNEVKTHTRHEEVTVYPYALFIEESYNNNQNLEECFKRMQNYSITNYSQEHDNIEEKLTDLKNIIIKYLPPPTDQDLLHSILVELFVLEKDLNNHSRIEEKILVPKIFEMENLLKEKLRNKF
jgi:regulator of cell morphogenesis and NO signaling